MNARFAACLIVCLGLCVFSNSVSFGEDASTPDGPNILLMLADDLSYTDVGCYGSVNGITPNIDHLAAQGMRFTHCYNAMAMCAPTRNMLYTGLFPVRGGSYRNHTFARPGTLSMVHYLGDLGYRVGIAGKTHIKPKETFPFESVGGITAGQHSRAPDDMSKLQDFMTRDDEAPFCLVIGSPHPHSPWQFGDPAEYPPNELELPPHWIDTPETREAYSMYLGEAAHFDRQLGAVLAALDETGLGDDTLFLFLSEQGNQFPNGKWSCGDQGLRAAAIARWPGVVEEGVVSDAMIQYVDVVPTFVDAAGGDSIEGLDGSSFLGVLTGETTEHGTYAYGAHNNLPEGPAYPIRCIRMKQYSYIWNLTPDVPYIVKWIKWINENTFYGPYYFGSWETAAEEDLKAAELLQRYEQRPEEELYDLVADPWELNNLADDPNLQDVKQELRAELIRWMEQQGDTGVELDVLPEGRAPPQPPRRD
jgi:N-sulfoglucosamine sulfohydrolase